MAVKLYVGMVAVLAVVAGVVASVTVPGAHHLPVAAALLFVVLVAASEYLQIRYYHHDEVDAINLMEGLLAPLVFVSSGLVTSLVVVGGLALANTMRRNPLTKAVFNTAQWLLAAAVASIVIHALRPGDPRSSLALTTLIIGMLVMSVINQVALSGVLTLVTGSPMGSRTAKVLDVVVFGHLVSILGALVTGVCLTAAYLWSPWTLIVGITFIVAAHATGRAIASLRADGARLAGLQRATHALATSIDMQQALPVFLTEARVGFEVRAVQLVLNGPTGTTVHTCVEGQNGCTSTGGHHELADLLLRTTHEPTRLAAGADGPFGKELERLGYQRAMAVPLRAATTTTGVLFLYDRVGMEGFENGEVSVASALSRELVSFLERVELVGAIEEERRKLAEILESTSDGILTIEADGTVTSWNHGLVEMTGYAADEMVGTRHFGLLRARDGSGRDVIIERWLDTMVAGQSLPEELQVVSRDGQALWLSCSYSRIPAAEGRRDVLVVVARNITQARELERLKDDFVAVVSHELRTPLVPIKGWAQTLLNRGDRLNDDQRRTAVQSILAQAQKLESLVLNILEASRIEAGRADGDGVADVAAITMRIVEDTLSARPDRTVRVRPPSVPCQVRGSSVWVERALSNLVANAVKYSPDDEPVDVAITVEGDDILVSVTDRGPGIAPDSQARIFERFERLEETSKQTGTGLGLYITRRLARAMGGEVTVSSVPGAGSTFLLRLPSAPVTRIPEQRLLDKEAREQADNVVNLR
ncbi:MAG: PAS domain S-box protein [Frankiales bacterium]|nr:PAS domain S-box protein [Frankiales bacterium]